MLPIVPAGYAYTEKEVRNALRAKTGVRIEQFRYELLTPAKAHKAWLGTVTAGSVAYDAAADIKRSARFTWTETADVAVNYLNDRVKPWMRLLLPDAAQGTNRPGYVEWPLGVFLLNSPSRSVSGTPSVQRDVEAFDQLILLEQDTVTDPYYVAAGYVVTTAISELLATISNITYTITTSGLTLPAQLMWEAGTPKRTIINDLCAAINYEPLYFDNAGQGVVRPAVQPIDATSAWTYSDDAYSITTPEMTQTADLFALPNVWVMAVSDPDRGLLRAQWTNNDPTSPTSTVSRGRSIVSVDTSSDAVNQAVLNVQVEAKARADMATFETYEFSTALMPLHGHGEVITLANAALGVDEKLGEAKWDMELRAGAAMKHTAQKALPQTGALS